MAWRAIPQQVDKNEGRATAVVLFTDEVQYKLLVTFDLLGQTAESFRVVVEAKRLQFERSYWFIETFDPQTFKLSVEPVKVEPTERDMFFTLYAKLQQWQRLRDTGLIQPDDANLATALKDAQAAFDPTFFA